MSEKDDMVEVDELGRVTWHCSEEGGGPDVGISLGLGNGRMLWCGEITKDRWEDAGPEAAALGNDFGWWIILYAKDETKVIGKCLDQRAAQDMIETLAAALQEPQP